MRRALGALSPQGRGGGVAVAASARRFVGEGSAPFPHEQLVPERESE
ncbi:MAG: hypothetical protein HPY83_14580 [Anaerolineae bacterium]|nr:hypothetical protein [Anaerolineae bacterium]